jgi:hypothetical protein
MKKLGLGIISAALFGGLISLMSACQPGGLPDGGAASPTAGKLGIIQVPQQTYPAPNRNEFVAENAYLIATANGGAVAVGTGLTWVAAQTSFVDTGPNFWIHNNEPVNSGRTIYLDYLKLISTAVGTAAVSWQYAVILDPVPRTITTNHLLAITPYPMTSQGVKISSPTINVQNSATASVFSASSASSWLAARGVIGGLNIAGHVYTICFGDTNSASGFVGSTDTAGTPGHTADVSGPIGVAPGQDVSIYIWGPSSSASLAPEFELGMVAR